MSLNVGSSRMTQLIVFELDKLECDIGSIYDYDAVLCCLLVKSWIINITGQ